MLYMEMLGSQKVQKVEKIYHVRMSSGLSQKWPILILKMDFLAILSIYKRISKLFIVQMFVTCCGRYFFLANNAVIYCNRPQKDKQKKGLIWGGNDVISHLKRIVISFLWMNLEVGDQFRANE